MKCWKIAGNEGNSCKYFQTDKVVSLKEDPGDTVTLHGEFSNLKSKFISAFQKS